MRRRRERLFTTCPRCGATLSAPADLNRSRRRACHRGHVMLHRDALGSRGVSLLLDAMTAPGVEVAT